MAAVLYWRLTALTTPEAGPLPWLPHLPHAIHDHPAWDNYLTKRAQHVADLACQIRDLATRARDQPVWAPPGSHPSTALIGDIAVWRAACGIDPQDPGPTGGHQPEAVPDLWKQHLDRDVARAIEPHNSNVDQRQPPRKALNHGYDDIQRPYQTPRRRLRLRPAASDRSQVITPWQTALSGRIGQLTADSGSFEIKAARFAAGRCAACLLAIPSAASLCRTSRTVISRESRTFGKIGIQSFSTAIARVNRPSTATDQKPATSWAS